MSFDRKEHSAKAGAIGGRKRWGDPASRFWKNVSVDGAKCWPWVGKQVVVGGYGRTYLRGRKMLSHRAAWFLTYGEIPENALVCHKCDNPPCCNPGHMFLGTAQDNSNDAKAKGRIRTPAGEKHWSKTNPERVPSGEQHTWTKLSLSDVLAIRSRTDAGEKAPKLAREFAVTRQCIYAIVARKNWKQV